MADRHAFREAGGPGRVHDLGDVVVHPGDRRKGLARCGDCACIEDDGVCREPAGLSRQQVSRRDQTTGARVGEYVLDLARAEHLVHDDGDRASGERAEERRGRVSTPFEQDRDPIVGPDPRGAQRSADRRGTITQGGIADGAVSFHDRGPVAAERGTTPQQQRRVQRRGRRAGGSPSIHRQRSTPREWLGRGLATSVPGAGKPDASRCASTANGGTVRVARARQGCSI